MRSPTASIPPFSGQADLEWNLPTVEVTKNVVHYTADKPEEKVNYLTRTPRSLTL